MPATFTDQFFLIDPANPPAGGTALNFSKFDLIDQNDDGDIDRFDNDTVNGSDVTSSYPGDTVTVNVPGTGNVTYVGITFYLANGQVVFTPTDGQVLSNGTLVSSTFVNGQGPLDTGTDLGPPCFVAGTMILTPKGERPVETLKRGDMVCTRDSGDCEIVWVAQRTVDGQGDFAPIRFKAGAVGNSKALLVSPQHRMFRNDWRAELLVGEPEILVAAKHLVNDETITSAPCKTVTYCHLMFDKHQIIYAEGAPTESLDPNAALLSNDRDYLRELLHLCPELRNRPRVEDRKLARTILKPHEYKVLEQIAPLDLTG